MAAVRLSRLADISVYVVLNFSIVKIFDSRVINSEIAYV